MSARTWRWDGNWLVKNTDEPHGWEMVLYYTTADDGLHGASKDKALIAAAPDLLAAAKMAEDLIRNGGIVPVKGMSWVALTAAIAKAEGRE